MWQLFNIFLLLAPYHLREPHCGVERAAEKCLADLASTSIHFHPILTNVREQIALVRDPCWQRYGGRIESEQNVYRIKGYILGVKWENGKGGDGDYHIVIGDEPNATETMICEVPDPNCELALFSGRSPEYAAIRMWVDSEIKRVMHRLVTSTFLVVDQPIPITVEGVGYWDRPHSSRGGAPSGRELHPGIGVN